MLRLAMLFYDLKEQREKMTNRNPEIQFWTVDGHELEVSVIYEEDGILCIDLKKKD